MRGIIAWVPYWAGDLCERIGLAGAYQKLMGMAVRVQGGGKGPWL